MNRWARWAAAACWLAAFAATPVTTRALDNSDRLLGWWDERTKDDVKTTTCFRILNASGQAILLRVEFLDADENSLDRLERTLTKNRDLEELCVEDLLAAGLNLGVADHGTVDFRAVDPGEARTPVAAIVGFQKELFYRSVLSAVGIRPGQPIASPVRRTLVAASEANLKSVPRPLRLPLPPKLIELPILIRLEGRLEGQPLSATFEGRAHYDRWQQIGTKIPFNLAANLASNDGSQNATLLGTGYFEVEKQDPESGEVWLASAKFNVRIDIPSWALVFEGTFGDMKIRDLDTLRVSTNFWAPMYPEPGEYIFPWGTFLEAWMSFDRRLTPPPGGTIDPRITAP